MTAGFVPQRPPALDDHEVGVVYEPAGRQASGGDVFGIWTLPGGGLGLLVGDVSGSGLEVAATAAMVRFFVEARTFDCDRPAEVLRQTNAILLLAAARGPVRPHLPRDRRRPRAALVQRRAPAAAPAPRGRGRRAGGLGTTGLPLGIDPRPPTASASAPSPPATCSSPRPTASGRRAATACSSATRGSPACSRSTAARWRRRQLAERLRDEAHAWSPELDDDLVVLAVRVRR